MSEDMIAVMVTVGFFAAMAAWVPLVESCERRLRHTVTPARVEGGVITEKTAKSGRGYEAAVVVAMVAAMGSLVLLN